MHGFGTRAHSNAKIAALVAPPGSCALDVREETSVSARMNVTRMGRSAQSLDEYLDGRPYCNARPSKVKVRSCGMDATLKIQADMPHAHKSGKEEFFGGLESRS
ncbi:hypothetical protein F4604DRAFT_1901976 [Suillus subluteus]|nr:hypothetical protein F4604DRAFT_1901976 [Suillus subluteus]